MDIAQTFSYPFDPLTLKDEQFKLFCKGEAQDIIEVSFPTQRVPQMKIVTPKYTLKTRKLTKLNLVEVREGVQVLVDNFKDMEKGDILQLPTFKIKLVAKGFCKIEADYETPTNYKKISDGWFKQWEEAEFVDFFL